MTIVVALLEKQLSELMDEYKRKAAAVQSAQYVASVAERDLRAFAALVVRESGGKYSEEKILRECSLTIEKEKIDDETTAQSGIDPAGGADHVAGGGDGG